MANTWLMRLAVSVLMGHMSSVSLQEPATHLVQAATQNDDFDFFLFVRQFGPAFCESRSSSCSVEPFNQFTLHGLWPNYYNGYPQYCDSKDEFSTKNLESDTLNQMDCEWQSLTGTNAGFWDHEWSKHGTCSLSVLPTQEEYFAKALELNSQYDLNVAMEENGIDLSSGGDVRTQDIEQALEESFGVSGVALRCSSNALVEVQMCIDKTTFEAFSCPSSIGSSCSSYADILSSPTGDVPAQCAAYFPDAQQSSGSSTTRAESSAFSSFSSCYFKSSMVIISILIMLMLMMSW